MKRKRNTQIFTKRFQMNNEKGSIKRALLGVLVIFSAVFCIILICRAGEMAYKVIFKRKIRVEYFKEQLAAEIKRMNTVITAAQNTPVDLANILEFHPTSETEMRILQESVLFNSEELYGCAVAFEPYTYNKDSLYCSFYAFRENDSLIFTNLNNPAYEYFYKDWYLIAKTLNQPVWSEPYYDTGGGNKLMTTYSVPFFQFMGNGEKFAGVVTIDVSIEWLADAVTSVGKMLKTKAALISENGTILSAPNRDLIYSETIYSVAEERNLPVLRETGRALKQGKSGVKKAYDGDQAWYIFYSPVPANRWGFMLFIPEEELLEREIKSLKKLL